MAGLTVAGGREPDFSRGLLPVVVQSADDKAVLMLAWANEQALDATLRSGDAHFWSRSRDSLWRKGETSGNVLRVHSVALDCDGDSLLYRVQAAGPACHTGRRSCFDAADDHASVGLAELERIVASRVNASPAESYTARLLADGPRMPAAKVVEEAGEVAVAALSEGPDRLAEEAADLLYHLLVLLRSGGVPLADVEARLAARQRK
ncbi:bifunctional phosphoribosyl-AMP cyclohydrolase/phosphoribosyl-ATP diphosphatase HisIE [soil metagenome]